MTRALLATLLIAVAAGFASLVPSGAQARNCPPPPKGQIITPGCSEGQREERIGPDACPLPPGCDLKQPSTCRGGISACNCNSLPGMVVVYDGNGNEYCVPDRKPKHCPAIPIPNVAGAPTDPGCQFFPIRPRNSVDPNLKLGTTGATAAGFVAGTTPFTYAVLFENLPTATGAAQVVVVTDQLDVATLDLDTFQFGPISFGRYAALVPSPGDQSYKGGIDLRPEQNLVLAVQAGLDRDTGRVTWTFVSIDPATGQLTDDPDAGFLPPNVAPPAGEGKVLFSVAPKTGLATGTAIANKASIVFDTNAAIETPLWSNTIDRDAPVTKVAALPASQVAPSFTVQWSGTDAGAGILAYDVYVSDNGGPYTRWIEDTTDTSRSFPGLAGHVYRFFSIGRDGVGNVEPMKSVAEATTRIALLAVSTTNVASSPNPSVVGQPVTFTATVTGTGAVPAGSVTFFAGGASLCPAVPLDPAGQATCTTASLTPAGSPHLIEAEYAGNATYDPSLGTLPGGQVVNRFPTSTTLAASPASPLAGAPLSLTATVSGLAPTGTVAFSDGSAVLPGCAAAPLAGTGDTRSATCTATAPAAGAYTFAANYTGNATNAASSGLAPLSVAAACNVFTDLPGSSPFCPNVEWLRNRAVTLGCAADRYCPDSSTTRLEMAAFMNRLGTALQPRAYTAQESSGGLNLDPGSVVCRTAAIPTATFPRRVFIDFVLSGRGAGAATFAADAIVSFDGGTTWAPSGSMPPVTTAPDQRWATVRGHGAADIAPGEVARFGVSVARYGSGSGGLGDSECRLRLTVHNRNGSSSPY